MCVCVWCVYSWREKKTHDAVSAGHDRTEAHAFNRLPEGVQKLVGADIHRLERLVAETQCCFNPTGVFQQVIAKGCADTGLNQLDYLLSALQAADHAYVSLLLRILPGLLLIAFCIFRGHSAWFASYCILYIPWTF